MSIRPSIPEIWPDIQKRPEYDVLSHEVKKKLVKIKILELKKQKIKHLLMLFDKICKYEMDLASVVEDTKLIQFCPQTDRQCETSKLHSKLNWIPENSY